MIKYDFDTVIIGGGPGGLRAAFMLASHDKKVAIIEKEHLGGICLNEGCIPTKTINSATNLFFKDFGKIGLDVDFKVKIEYLRTRAEQIVLNTRKFLQSALKKYNITLINTQNNFFEDDHTLVTDSNKITFDKAIIATGAKTFIPKLFSNINYLTHKQALELPQVDEITIIGSGPIGCEFAFIFKSLGANVTIIEIKDRLLSNFTNNVSTYMKNYFDSIGIKTILNSTIIKAEEKNSKIILTFENGNTVETTNLLLATGRTPNLEILENSSLHINIDKLGIQVNRFCQTNIPNIYAIGDCNNSNLKLAHKAYFDALIATNHIINNNSNFTEFKNYVPAVIYLYPEIAQVGDYEQISKSAFYDFKHNMIANIYAMKGFLELGFNNDNKICYAALGHPKASELIHIFQIAIAKGLTKDELLHLPYAHPSVMECIFDIVKQIN